MKIMLFVKGSYALFKCEGIFEEPVTKVKYRPETQQFDFFLKHSGPVPLEIPVDPQVIEAIGDHLFCGIGFYHNNQILGAKMVPLEMSVQNGRADA